MRYPEAIPAVENYFKEHSEGASTSLQPAGHPGRHPGLMQDLCQLLQVWRLHTSAYHPQTDGLVKCFNQTLKRMLRHVGVLQQGPTSYLPSLKHHKLRWGSPRQNCCLDGTAGCCQGDVGGTASPVSLHRGVHPADVGEDQPSHPHCLHEHDLQDLGKQYRDMFSSEPSRTTLVQHHISTPPGTIVRQRRPYHMPEAHR